MRSFALAALRASGAFSRVSAASSSDASAAATTTTREDARLRRDRATTTTRFDARGRRGATTAALTSRATPRAATTAARGVGVGVDVDARGGEMRHVIVSCRAGDDGCDDARSSGRFHHLANSETYILNYFPPRERRGRARACRRRHDGGTSRDIPVRAIARGYRRARPRGRRGGHLHVRRRHARHLRGKEGLDARV
eukprot:10916-Pelagococcus_subviridis.AAC.3